MPPTGLVLAAIASVQFGAALAATLFDDLGAAGTAFVRVALAAVLLALLWRPRLARHTRAELGLAVVFGLVLGGMNLCFYLALDRIPLGIAVTLEFLGPLGVAVAMSRRALDLVWVALAAAGIVLLSSGELADLDPVGMAFALGAGALWAAYILLGARLGRAFPRGHGLSIAMVVAALVLVPAGVVDAGSRLLDAEVLAIGLGVAVLSSAIPYSLELEALRRLPARVFGVLMSVEPAVAALAGYLVLDQGLSTLEGLAIGLVVLASAGATLGARAPVASDVPAASAEAGP